MNKEIEITANIRQSTKADSYKPWIRVPKSLRGSKIKNKQYVKIWVNDRFIYCQIRGTVDESSKNVEMNEHFRILLGWDEIPKEEVTLKVTKTNTFVGIYQMAVFHPDDVVRTGLGLGFASVSLGFLSVVLALAFSVSPEMKLCIKIPMIAACGLFGLGFLYLAGITYRLLFYKDSLNSD